MIFYSQFQPLIRIINGNNTGVVFLELNYLEENKVAGSLQLYDEMNLTFKIKGTIKEGKSISGEIYDFYPQKEGMPNSGNVELLISEDNKEMKGSWKTDINTSGECILYKFATPLKQDLLTPTVTLEKKHIHISFSTFEKKNIEDIFFIMTFVANNIRKGKEQKVNAPIYTITYDKEEMIRTYNLEVFLNKFNIAEKIGI